MDQFTYFTRNMNKISIIVSHLNSKSADFNMKPSRIFLSTFFWGHCRLIVYLNPAKIWQCFNQFKWHRAEILNLVSTETSFFSLRVLISPVKKRNPLSLEIWRVCNHPNALTPPYHSIEHYDSLDSNLLRHDGGFYFCFQLAN